jgi:hypothetical protein
LGRRAASLASIEAILFALCDGGSHVGTDAKVQRWFGFTNFFWLPLGRSFDNRSAVNVSTPRQFTVTPQFGYTEGLGKISPSLNGLFFDLVANASFRTNGNSPLEVVNPPNAPLPGLLTYETLTQRPSWPSCAIIRARFFLPPLA